MTRALAKILLFSVLAGSPAWAASPAQQGLSYLSQLNLTVFTNMTGGDDVEGRTFVGGNLSNAATYGIGASANPHQGTAASSFRTLTVGGSVTGNTNINNGPNAGVANGINPPGAVIGGNAGLINLNANNAVLQVGGSIGLTNGGNGATISVGGGLGGNSHPNGISVAGNLGAGFSGPLVSGINAETALLKTDFTALSNALAALAPTAGSSFNNGVFTGVASGGRDYAVIDVTAAQLEQQNLNFTFHLQSNGHGGFVTTIINVTGGAFTDNANSNGNSVYNPYVIWNFPTATSLTFNREMNGSVLGVNATISNNTPIEGSVVAKAFNQGGEVHLGDFAGVGDFLPGGGVGVPEASSWMMLISGIASLGLVLRRRRIAA